MDRFFVMNISPIVLGLVSTFHVMYLGMHWFFVCKVVLGTVIKLIVRLVGELRFFLVNLCPIVLGLISRLHLVVVRLLVIRGRIILLLVLVGCFFLSKLFVENMVVEIVTILVFLIVKMRRDVFVRTGVGVIVIMVVDWVYVVLNVLVVAHLVRIVNDFVMRVCIFFMNFKLVFIPLMLPIVGVTVSVLERSFLFFKFFNQGRGRIDRKRFLNRLFFMVRLMYGVMVVSVSVFCSFDMLTLRMNFCLRGLSRGFFFMRLHYLLSILVYRLGLFLGLG